MLPHDHAYRFVVGVNLPDGDLPVFYDGPPGSRHLPKVVFAQLTVFGKRTLRRAEDGYGIHIGKDHAEGDRIVRHHLEVALPRRLQLGLTFNTVAEGVDKDSLGCHQAADGCGVARIDELFETQNYVDRIVFRHRLSPHSPAAFSVVPSGLASPRCLSNHAITDSSFAMWWLGRTVMPCGSSGTRIRMLSTFCSLSAS